MRHKFYQVFEWLKLADNLFVAQGQPVLNGTFPED